MPPLHRKKKEKYDPLTVIVYVFFFYFIIILFFFFLGYTFVSWHFVIAIYGAHLCFAVAHVLPLRANTWYTLYYFRLALLLGPLEMPVLNTTKLVSFALGVWIQFASISFLLLLFFFCAALPTSGGAPHVAHGVSFSQRLASYHYVYAWPCWCVSVCLCECLWVSWRAAYVTLLAFNLSYRYFFLFICVFLPVKMNFSTFHIVHCCCFCCCCGSWSLNATKTLRFQR